MTVNGSAVKDVKTVNLTQFSRAPSPTIQNYSDADLEAKRTFSHSFPALQPAAGDTDGFVGSLPVGGTATDPIPVKCTPDASTASKSVRPAKPSKHAQRISKRASHFDTARGLLAVSAAAKQVIQVLAPDAQHRPVTSSSSSKQIPVHEPKRKASPDKSTKLASALPRYLYVQRGFKAAGNSSLPESPRCGVSAADAQHNEGTLPRMPHSYGTGSLPAQHAIVHVENQSINQSIYSLSWGATGTQQTNRQK